MPKKKNDWYARLNRIFRSGPAIKRRVRDYREPPTSTALELFNRTQSFVYSNAINAYGQYDRLSRYADFSEMEYMPEISAALDIYADETVSQDENGRVLHIFSENRKLRELLEELFYDVLNVEFNLRMWARNIIKYGDFFLFNDVAPGHGIIQVFPIPVNEVEREEGFDPEDPLAVRFRWVTQGNVALENWQMTHFRMLGNDAFLPYGSSIIEPARRIWRQLILVEDAMLVYRIIRSPERRIFYIDVGGIPPEEVPAYMEAQERRLRSNTVIDRSSGRIDFRYNPLSVEEDYFIPVRGSESGTKIDTLAGGQHVSATEDVEYIQKKLFAALKIPRAYLGYDEMLSSKATLAQEDIRFSRTIQQIQKVILAELQKLAYIHLFMHGYEGDDLFDFTLRLNNPSSIAQQQKLELFARKFEIVNNAVSIDEGRVFSVPYLLSTIMDIPESKQRQIMTQVIEDTQRRAALAKIAEGAVPESVGFMQGGTFVTPTQNKDAGVESGGESAGTGADEDESELGGEKGGIEDLFQSDAPVGDILSDVDTSTTDDENPALFDDEEDEEDDDENTQHVTSSPIKVSRELRTKQRNRRRSQMRHGPMSTHMPDFARMLSMTDVQDRPADARSLYSSLKDALNVRLEHLMSIEKPDSAIVRERVNILQKLDAIEFLERYATFDDDQTKDEQAQLKPRITGELRRIFDRLDVIYGDELKAHRIIDERDSLLTEAEHDDVNDNDVLDEVLDEEDAV